MIALLLSLAPLAGAPQPATAPPQPATAERGRGEADALFSEGESFFERGQFRRAAEIFYRAYELAPHPAVLANAAFAFDEAGDLVRAVELYRRYLDEPVEQGPNERVLARLTELRRRTADLLVRCTPEPCDVWVDGDSRGTTPSRIAVMPGRRHVRVLSGAGPQLSRDVEAAAGESLQVEFAPDARVAAEPPRRRQILAWSLAGVATAAGAGAALYGAKTLDARRRYADSAYTDQRSRREGLRSKTWTNTLLALSATAGGAAIGLFLWPTDSPRPADGAATQTATSVQLTYTGHF